MSLRTLVHLHNSSQFHTFQVNHQSLQWNVCAQVNNFFSNLIEFVDFSNLRGATVGWFISFSGLIHFRHRVMRFTANEVTWYKFLPLSYFLLGTSCLPFVRQPSVGRHLIPSTKLTSSSHKTFHFSYMKVLDEMFIKVKVSSIFKEKNNSG